MQCAINSVHDVEKLFPKTPHEINQKKEQCKQLILDGLKEIIAIPADKKALENTVIALDKIVEQAVILSAPIEALEILSPDKAIRDAAHEASIELSSFIVEQLTTNVDLYKAFKVFAEQTDLSNLSADYQYFVKEQMADFERHGLNLPEEKLAHVRQLMQELSKLAIEFEKNIAQHQCQVIVTIDELDGVPTPIIAALKKTDAGKYILGCDYPTVFAVLDHCTVEETRKKLFKAFNNRAYPVNMHILDQVIAKRNELAQLLSFASFNHLDLDDQMVKTPEHAIEFINSIVEKAKKKAHQEVKKFLSDLPESIKLTPEGKIQPWNVRFVKSAYKKKYLDLDDREIAQYFPLDYTLPQLLSIYEQFLGLRFKNVSAHNLWSDDLSMIEVYDAHSNDLLAYLILDLFPRPNKFSHAAHTTIVPAVKRNTTLCPSVSIVMANFPKPTPENPALLTYNDVNTFFHEFGHAMHAVLGRSSLAAMSGTHTKTDFVEMPSQMLEGWMKDHEILKKISMHYKTSEPLPDKIIAKLVELEKFDSGDATLRQLYFATLSLAYFDKEAKKDTQYLARILHEQFRPYIAWDNDDHHQAAFGHLMGYGSKYYGYMWSRVFAADLFKEIKKHGLLNHEIGKKYINEVIGKGGSQDPNELLVNFLGRIPSEHAFLIELGFID